MKLKLDLHPIFSRGERIEAALQAIIDEACLRRAAEVEIIPGKGSGALKKSVLRFLDRPEIKSRYHRVEKDSDNWGRLFVHFRWERPANAAPVKPAADDNIGAVCFACACVFAVASDPPGDGAAAAQTIRECPGCGSPNRITVRMDRRGRAEASTASGYE